MANINAASAEISRKVSEAAYEPSQFAIQAARTIQSTFADAFMSVGNGLDDLVRQFLDAFKRILAEAAAMQLAKALGLTEILEGKTPTSTVGKIIGTIFPGTNKGTRPGATAAGAASTTPGLEEIVVTATRIGVKTAVDSTGKATDREFPTDAAGFPIDVTRSRIENEDGTFSTEETITEWVDGLWRNIPTIVNGVRVTAEEATQIT